MEELIDKLNGLELIKQEHEHRADVVMNFLRIIGEILQQTGEEAASVLLEIENEYVKILENLDVI